MSRGHVAPLSQEACIPISAAVSTHHILNHSISLPCSSIHTTGSRAPLQRDRLLACMASCQAGPLSHCRFDTNSQVDRHKEINLRDSESGSTESGVNTDWHPETQPPHLAPLSGYPLILHAAQTHIQDSHEQLYAKLHISTALPPDTDKRL